MEMFYDVEFHFQICKFYRNFKKSVSQNNGIKVF